MNECDYLIVGGGIAALSLAYYFDQEQQDYQLVNFPVDGRASKFSSGLINPVTGRRLALSWNYETIQNEFLNFYRTLENQFSKSFISERSVYQVLETVEQQNVWLSRSNDPSYQNHFSESIISDLKDFNLEKNQCLGIIKSAWLVSVEILMTSLEKYFYQMSRYSKIQFHFTDLLYSKTELRWNGMKINKGIIFTEGYRVFENPFFNWLPVISLKGEGLKVQVPALELTQVFKSLYSIVPIGNNNFWIGSNFNLNDTECAVTASEKLKQLEFLNKYLKLPYEIREHFFGIRPASKDRRPIAGIHPLDNRIAIINGLGTKGFSLAPYCAKQLTAYLLRGNEMDPEINLNRFIKRGYMPQIGF